MFRKHYLEGGVEDFEAGVPRFCQSLDGGTQIMPNTNYKKNNPEIAQIRPYNTYRGVIKKLYVRGGVSRFCQSSEWGGQIKASTPLLSNVF